MPADALDTARRLKAIFVGSSAISSSGYDFYAYSAFALYFAGAFFPAESQTASAAERRRRSLPSASSMRPIGGWLFGHVADQHGRRLR